MSAEEPAAMTGDQLAELALRDPEAAKVLHWRRVADQARIDLEGVADLFARARLIIRCNDCRNLVVMYVAHVQNQPLVWTRNSRGTREAHWLSLPVKTHAGGVVSVLDPEFDVWSYCDRRWKWSGADVLASLPRPTERRAESRVSHRTSDVL